METRKLIVTDLDGTALKNWETLDEHTKDALIKAKEEGHIVVIATGRPARASVHFYKELGLDTPIINFNGAYIHHPENENFSDIVAQIPTDVLTKVTEFEIGSISNLAHQLNTDLLKKHSMNIQMDSFSKRKTDVPKKSWPSYAKTMAIS